MCSIEGFTGRNNFTIEQFTSFNKNRGPDDTNYFENGAISLGHNLLKISPNDTNKSQPYVTEQGNVLCFNGAIYGIDDQWDTEWLANRIEKDGIKSLAHNVNGQWAFAWYEASKNRVWLVRDHFGQKPLYYTTSSDKLFFSSTPKPLYALMNDHNMFDISANDFALYNTDHSRFYYGSNFPYRGIQRLAPGEIMLFDITSGKVTARDSLWDHEWNLDMNLKWDPEELEEEFVTCFNEVYDHGPGIKKTVSLSGGLDSTLITSILKDKEHFSATTCSWEDAEVNTEELNAHMLLESSIAEQTCNELGVEFNKSVVPRDFNPLMKEAYQALGIPIWDRNRIIPRYVNVKKAAENGNKVFMAGDCADEILTGYNGDFNTFFPHHARKKNFGKEWMNQNNNYVGSLRSFIPYNLFGNDHINNWNFTRTLAEGDSFCTVADHLAGSFGMESRLPFLHQRLAKYLLTVPGVYKLHVPFKHESFADDYIKRKDQRFWRMGNWKGMLRDHMKSYYPEHVLKRERKIGFANPWNARNDKLNQEYGKTDAEYVKLLHSSLTLDNK